MIGDNSTIFHVELSPIFYSSEVMIISDYKNTIDHEYSCVDRFECLFLREKRIRYTFVKQENGKTVWKYKKNTELANALKEYWKMFDK